MHTLTAESTIRAVLCAAAAVCSVGCGCALADNLDVTVAIPVSTQGIDLRRPSSAQELYIRIKQAARVACTRGDRVGLVPAADPRECVEAAIASAVRSVDAPLLTQAYLGAHTLREATTRGIQVPPQLATK